MSFFIRNTKSIKRKSNNFSKKGKPNQSVNFKKKNSQQDDEESIASTDEELAEENEQKQKHARFEESDDEYETAQEARLRLATKYLEEIKAEEEERKELDNTISDRLKEEYLEEKGILRKVVADKYFGHGELHTLKCKDHRDSVTCICISSDGQFLFSGSKDGSLVKWSLSERTKIKVLRGKRKGQEGIKSVRCLAVSTDCKYLVVGDVGCKEIKVFLAADFKHLKNLQGHRGLVSGVVFRKDTHTLYSSSDDRCVKVWNLDDMAYVESLFGHQNAITSIDALARERVITSGGYDGTVRIWKIAEESQLIFNGNGNIEMVKFINDEHFISCSDNGEINIWGCLKKKPLCSVSEAHGINEENNQPLWISSVAALVNTDLVASGSWNGVVKLWKCDNSFRSLHPLFTVKLSGFVNSLLFTPDGQYLIAGIGQEHRLGRWWRVSEAKNSIVIIPLNRRDEK